MCVLLFSVWCFFFVFRLLCFALRPGDACDSTQDYVTVLHQLLLRPFHHRRPTHDLIYQLIPICNTHQNMVNDLAEAMKASDGKKMERFPNWQRDVDLYLVFGNLETVWKR